MLFLLPFFCVVVVYVVGLLYLRHQWHRIPVVQMREAVVEECFISIVVVVRNEAENLPHLFQALQKQTLAPDQFELHLVNDASSDQTVAVIQEFQQQATFPVFLHQLALQQPGNSPKKAAITQVLPLLKGELVAVTDGDCQPAADWLISIKQLWLQQQPVFIAGPVRFIGEDTLFHQLQALDFAALIGVGAAMLQAGKPGMCNAANMAFSKAAFTAVGGYAGNEAVPSGDDEFLLQKLHHYAPERICFMKASGAVVSTQPCESWQQFKQQRKRWAGKWRLHQGYGTKALALLVFMSYLLIAASLVVPFFSPALAPAIVLAWLLKAVADYLFLRSILHFLKKPLLLKAFLLLELVYPFYVLFFAVVANTGSFIWKERSYRYSSAAHERTRIPGVR